MWLLLRLLSGSGHMYITDHTVIPLDCRMHIFNISLPSWYTICQANFPKCLSNHHYLSHTSGKFRKLGLSQRSPLLGMPLWEDPQGIPVSLMYTSISALATSRCFLWQPLQSFPCSVECAALGVLLWRRDILHFFGDILWTRKENRALDVHLSKQYNGLSMLQVNTVLS